MQRVTEDQLVSMIYAENDFDLAWDYYLACNDIDRQHWWIQDIELEFAQEYFDVELV